MVVQEVASEASFDAAIKQAPQVTGVATQQAACLAVYATSRPDQCSGNTPAGAGVLLGRVERAMQANGRCSGGAGQAASCRCRPAGAQRAKRDVRGMRTRRMHAVDAAALRPLHARQARARGWWLPIGHHINPAPLFAPRGVCRWRRRRWMRSWSGWASRQCHTLCCSRCAWGSTTAPRVARSSRAPWHVDTLPGGTEGGRSSPYLLRAARPGGVLL